MFLGTTATFLFGWVTISQVKLGAQLGDIREQMRGNFTAPPLQRLGYLWSLPDAASSSNGLGGGITWAWDPTLCERLLPRFHEDMLFVELVSCDTLKAAVHRAFASWSDNHALISFLDVTAECEAMGQTTADCPLAELWITALRPRPPRALASEEEDEDRNGENGVVEEEDADDDDDLMRPVNSALSSLGTVQEQASGQHAAAATAAPTARYSTSFRWASGRLAGGGSAAPMVETYRAVISFNVEPTFCWCLDGSTSQSLSCMHAYVFTDDLPHACLCAFIDDLPFMHARRYLDSTFCSRFHSLKRLASPELVLHGGRLLSYLTFAFALVLVLLPLACAFFTHVGDPSAALRPREVGRTLFARVAGWSTLYTALVALLLATPLTAYHLVFLPCV